MAKSDQKTKKLSRRDAIKLLGAVTGATILANVPSKWKTPEIIKGVLPAHAQTSNSVLPTVETVSIVDPSGINPPVEATFTGNVIDIGSSPVTDRGFEWSFDSNMAGILGSVSAGGGGVGPFSSANVPINNGSSDFYYGRAYATNSVGTAYGAIMQFSARQCLVEGTLIILADGTQKKIEEITYSDSLLVWNFDDGCFDTAQPLWIKRSAISDQYNFLEFSDGSFLKTVRGHRILNIEKGKFTYPHAEETPLGTTTFNANGENITLIKKSVVHEQVNFYNVITHKHINLFANGLLTSCRYNNIYPIADMKFVKDDRELISKEQYNGISDAYYEGLRLAEQNIPVETTLAYVKRLELRKASRQELASETVTNLEQFEAELVI